MSVDVTAETIAEALNPRMGDEVMMRHAGTVARKVFKLLGGEDPKVQGAVLADALAMFLAGHRMLDPAGGVNEAASAKLREAILGMHLRCVRELIPINARAIAAQQETGVA